MLDHLSRNFSCIIYDRREAGQSGGRVEHVTWADYVVQGKGLLEHLNIKRAHLMGGCMGCCPLLAFAVAYPEMVSSMILYWPVGGAKYRINGRKRFGDHLAYVDLNGLDKVVSLVSAEGKDVQRRSARRTVGCGYQERSFFCRIVCASGCSKVQVDRGRDVSDAF